MLDSFAEERTQRLLKQRNALTAIAGAFAHLPARCAALCCAAGKSARQPEKSWIPCSRY